jgi:diguanylate cyclase (GGDEF)-like protein
VVFCAAVLTAAVMILSQERNRLRIERTRALETATSFADALLRTMGRALSVTFALGALVQHERGLIADFESVARELLPYYPGAEALQLAPSGVVRQIYPLRGNEKALGHDLFRDPARVKEAVRTRDSGQLNLAGPFPLRQGGLGALGRMPIYLSGCRGEPRFWGFAIVLLRFPQVLEPAHLNRLADQGYDYILWRVHPDTGRRQVLASRGKVPLADPVEIPLRIADSVWMLDTVPRAGWGDPRGLILKGILGLVFSLLSAFLARLLLLTRAYSRTLEKLARFDALTGLPNRILLGERMDRALASARRDGTAVAVCYLDLDGFKAINDALGHEAGDRFLREIARRFLDCLREGDTVARLGGDEFVLLLTGLEGREACAGPLSRILRAAKRPLFLGGRKVRVSASVGVALYPRDGSEPEALVGEADRAMYVAKRMGRGHLVFREDLGGPEDPNGPEKPDGPSGPEERLP